MIDTGAGCHTSFDWSLSKALLQLVALDMAKAGSSQSMGSPDYQAYLSLTNSFTICHGESIGCSSRKEHGIQKATQGWSAARGTLHHNDGNFKHELNSCSVGQCLTFLSIPHALARSDSFSIMSYSTFSFVENHRCLRACLACMHMLTRHQHLSRQSADWASRDNLHLMCSGVHKVARTLHPTKALPAH